MQRPGLASSICRRRRVSRISSFAASIQMASILRIATWSSPRRSTAGWPNRAMTMREAWRCCRATSMTMIYRPSRPRCRRCFRPPAAPVPSPSATRIRLTRVPIQPAAAPAATLLDPRARSHTRAIRTSRVIISCCACLIARFCFVREARLMRLNLDWWCVLLTRLLLTFDIWISRLSIRAIFV